MAMPDRATHWSNELEGALGQLHPEQLASAVRAAMEAERSGAEPDDALWAGKAAAANWEDDRAPVDPIPENDDFEPVAIVEPSLAEVLKASLKTAGIPVVLKGGTGWIIGLTVGPEGEVSVLVPPSRGSEARELIAGSQPIGFPAGD